ncbi:MAG TPA: efflux RND transporter periplasmic adaptor subunit [Steroidobacteraceae bacterium]|jgi:membrane fusion protein (multidrug efflux system)|nr:efflux RND transporter periplasmic adaptor subunit [Steroidobacteraceae bacterium]
MRLLPTASLPALGLALAGALAAGCSPTPTTSAPQSPQVNVIRAKPQVLPLTRDLVGRVSAIRSADVRARVPGILLKRLYREGSEVKAGEALFEIDPKPYRAALDAALASLAQAQATATNAAVNAKRTRDLLPSGLVARSDVDNNNATERSSQAQVKQAEANVETARINLGYATVTAPISGRSGQQHVTEGALVGQSEATLLTTVDQIDRLYVNFDRPADEILKLRAAQSRGDVTLFDHDQATLQIILPDGTPYTPQGTLDFDDVTVDPTNAALAFRGIVANPQRRLLPGMFVTVHLTLGTLNHAYLVPQAIVRRDGNGAFVEVVGADDKVVQKHIQADTMMGINWLVTGGLNDGDQLIATSVDKVHPGMQVKVLAGNASGS